MLSTNLNRMSKMTMQRTCFISEKTLDAMSIPKAFTGAKFTIPSKNFEMKYVVNHAWGMPFETQTQRNDAMHLLYINFRCRKKASTLCKF